MFSPLAELFLAAAWQSGYGAWRTCYCCNNQGKRMKSSKRLFLWSLLAALAGAQTRQSIVIDHNSTDISRIPDQWIERAKALTIHYGHTSHGSQILSGLEALRRENPKYDYTAYSGQPLDLPAAQGALRIYDGQPDGTYITPDLYWSVADGDCLEQRGRVAHRAPERANVIQRAGEGD